jgi:hypothetical protein
MRVNLERMPAPVVAVGGWILLLTGIVLFPLPGPGLLLMAAGLALLAQRYDWAARRVDQVRSKALLGAARSVVRTRDAIWSVLATTALTASGALWLWDPPQPDWWVLPHWTWLPGGLWSAVGQIGSGLVTLALVVDSIRRYHGRPEAVAELERRLRGGLDDAASRDGETVDTP